jgi:hypothetical protein
MHHWNSFNVSVVPIFNLHALPNLFMGTYSIPFVWKYDVVPERVFSIISPLETGLDDVSNELECMFSCDIPNARVCSRWCPLVLMFSFWDRLLRYFCVVSTFPFTHLYCTKPLPLPLTTTKMRYHFFWQAVSCRYLSFGPIESIIWTPKHTETLFYCNRREHNFSLFISQLLKLCQWTSVL